MNEMDRIVADASGRLGALHDATDALASIRVERRSADGSVTATVDGSGALVHLVLADDLSTTTTSVLERTIVDTARFAAEQALADREAVLQSLHGSFTDT